MVLNSFFFFTLQVIYTISRKLGIHFILFGVFFILFSPCQVPVIIYKI